MAKHPITKKPLNIEVSPISGVNAQGYRLCVFKVNGTPYVAYERRVKFLWWSWLEYRYDGMHMNASQLAQYLVYYRHLTITDSQVVEPEPRTALDTP